MISVANRQRSVRFDLGWLQRGAELALAKCVLLCADGRHALRALAAIEVAIVSDRTIARVHRQFLNEPGATDVITFEHGEIVIGAQTSRGNAAHYGRTLEQELLLYTIHGLLHLNGFADGEARASARMQRAQERILGSCLRKLPPPSIP